jgi:hypothetical protein
MRASGAHFSDGVDNDINGHDELDGGLLVDEERERETERQRDRETERQRDRETERQRDRKTERQKERESERKRRTGRRLKY